MVMLLPLRGKKINQRKKEKKQRKIWQKQRLFFAFSRLKNIKSLIL